MSEYSQEYEEQWAHNYKELARDNPMHGAYKVCVAGFVGLEFTVGFTANVITENPESPVAAATMGAFAVGALASGARLLQSRREMMAKAKPQLD